MSFLAQVLIVVGCMAIAACAGQCGKPSGRISMQRGAVRLSSPEFSTTGSCRWRYSTVRGLHLKFTFSKFSINPCCANLTIFNAIGPSLFNWENEKILSNPSGVKVGTYELIVPTYNVGVRYESEPGKSSFDVTIKPVLPPDGNCGYRTKAFDRIRIIRTPGHPRPGYTNNMACLWTIFAEEGKSIKLEIIRVETASRDDYLEVRYDGTVKRHWGTASKNVAYYSVGNEMELYFHSDGMDTDKGFVAKYIAITPNTTDVVEPVGGNTCWKQTLIRSAILGTQVIDVPRKVTCPPGTKCGHIYGRGFGTTMAMEVETESSDCLPSSGCDLTSCDAIPSNDPNVVLSECRTTCCDGDLCNTQNIETVEPRGPITCYNSMLMKGVRTSIMVDTSEETTCPTGQVCMMLTTRASMGPLDVNLVQGSCLPQSACGRRYCKKFSSSPVFPPGMSFSGCHVTCCNTNLCNKRPEE